MHKYHQANTSKYKPTDRFTSMLLGRDCDYPMNSLPYELL